jgi:hypothetical protein
MEERGLLRAIKLNSVNGETHYTLDNVERIESGELQPTGAKHKGPPPRPTKPSSKPSKPTRRVR